MAKPSYCAEQVRRFDNDRFLCFLFAPTAEREALAAVYAFNLEVARIRESVAEPLLGQMRLQWWCDAIEGIYGGRPLRHQVVVALDEAVRTFNLSRHHFERLLEARAFDLDNAPPADLAALVDYADATSATLSALALEVLGVHDARVGQAARDVAIAWALVGLIRAIPFHARARRPARWSVVAAASPANPAPMTTTSERSGSGNSFMGSSSQKTTSARSSDDPAS